MFFCHPVLLLLAGALLVAGCASRSGVSAPIPPTALATASVSALASFRAPADPVPGPTIFSRQHRADAALSADAIRLLVWNVHKGRDDEWSGDFRTLASDSDLVLLQEAHLHEEFTGLLASSERWDLAEAWWWRGAPTGVLTASAVAPLSVRALHHREPLLRTGKTALVTEYRIAGSDLTLLVANIHAINFTVDTRAFRAQLAAVAALLAGHEGPVILSGDLNTWREERRQILHDIAGWLSLHEVMFAGPRKQFGKFPLDHVFYRGLELLANDVPPVASSDHNPLLATFRLPGGSDSSNHPVTTAMPLRLARQEKP